MFQSPAEAVRSARAAAGLSQRSLAIRAGTSQGRISRIECGLEAPSFERLTTLLLVMGRQPTLGVEPLEHDHDEGELHYSRSLTADQRMAEAAAWNLMAAKLAQAGREARVR